jgi:hypothetical protein
VKKIEIRIVDVLNMSVLMSVVSVPRRDTEASEQPPVADSVAENVTWPMRLIRLPISRCVLIPRCLPPVAKANNELGYIRYSWLSTAGNETNSVSHPTRTGLDARVTI